MCQRELDDRVRGRVREPFVDQFTATLETAGELVEACIEAGWQDRPVVKLLRQQLEQLGLVVNDGA